MQLGEKKIERVKEPEVTAVTIIDATFVKGSLAVPGDVFQVPGEVSKKDAKLLIGIGRADPGEKKPEELKKLRARFEAGQDESAKKAAAMHVPPYLRGAADAAAVLQSGGGQPVDLEAIRAQVAAELLPELTKQVTAQVTAELAKAAKGK